MSTHDLPVTEYVTFVYAVRRVASQSLNRDHTERFLLHGIEDDCSELKTCLLYYDHDTYDESATVSMVI